MASGTKSGDDGPSGGRFVIPVAKEAAQSTIPNTSTPDLRDELAIVMLISAPVYKNRDRVKYANASVHSFAANFMGVTPSHL